jgi:hypothetical protein
MKKHKKIRTERGWNPGPFGRQRQWQIEASVRFEAQKIMLANAFGFIAMRMIKATPGR